MDKRFKQANNEALWSVSLTFVYLLCWIVTAYCLKNQPYIWGMPYWFFISCIVTPIFFIILCILMIKYHYKEVPLGNNNDED